MSKASKNVNVFTLYPLGANNQMYHTFTIRLTFLGRPKIRNVIGTGYWELKLVVVVRIEAAGTHSRYKMIASLFQLPRSVISDLLSGWLCIKDLGRLDSAICQNGVRPLMEESFRTTLLRHTEHNCRISSKCAMWMTKRNLQLKELFIGVEFDQFNRDLQRRFFRSTGKTLRTIVVERNHDYYKTETMILDLSLFATAIEVCIIKASISEMAVGVLLATNGRLRVLLLNGGVGVLHCITQLNCCNYLTDLTICRDVSADALLAFLSLNPPRLQKLCLAECHEFDSVALTTLQDFTQLCTLHVGSLQCSDLENVCYPNIFELKIGMSSYNAQTIASIATAFPSVTMLTIGPCDTEQRNVNELLEMLVLMPKLRQFTAWSGQVETDYTKPLIVTVPAHQFPCSSSNKDAHSALEQLYINIDPFYFDFARLVTLCPALYDIGFNNLPMFTCAMQSTNGRIHRMSALTHSCVTDNNVALIHGLQELVLLNGRNLTVAGFCALARNNPQLRVLNVKNINMKVSYKGLMVFLESCPLLTSVTYMVEKPSTHITYCEANVMLDRLCRNSYPNLKHFVSNIV